MKISVATSSQKSECFIVPVYASEKPQNIEKDIERQFGDTLSKSIKQQIVARMKEKDFEGELDTTLSLYPTEGAKKIILIGLGKSSEKYEPDTLRKIGAVVSPASQKYTSVTLVLPKPLRDDAHFTTFFEGYFLGNYTFDKYLTKKSDKCVTREIFCTGISKKALSKIAETEKLCANIRMLRDMINTPANDMSPLILEKLARELSKYKNIKIKVLDFNALKKMKAGGIVAVGQGAAEKSRMVILEYKNKPKNKKPYAFVGKGVTFDTGGINLKPSKHIEDMKLDMTGAATVLALFKTFGELQPDIHAVGIMGIVENAISRDAYKPGDIITALNGKTIEILNTDAEGRLVLADCLTYVEKEYKPEFIIDLATLTGHAVYAVGHDITPIMGNNKALITELLEVGKRTDEIMWELPMHHHYRKAVKGTIADLDNSADSVKAGTITAAMFLEHFINNNTPWVHCDIAGTGYGDKSDGPYKPAGGRGVLLRSLWEFVTKAR